MWWIYKLEPPVKQRTSREEENELETASIKGDHMVATARRNQVVTNLWKTNSMLLSLIFFHHNICWDSKLVFDDYSSKLKDVLFASLYVVCTSGTMSEKAHARQWPWHHFLPRCHAGAILTGSPKGWFTLSFVIWSHLDLVCTFSTRSWNEQERSH